MTDSSVPAQSKPSASDMALTLNQISGIYASCVVLNSDRDIDEVHIVASTNRKPKQIVRDVETILFVKHRTRIDYRKISLVQITDEELLRMPIARPEVHQVKEDILGNQRRIQVEIRAAGCLVIGEAYEKIDNPKMILTSAKATLNAIKKLINQSLDFRVEDAQIFGLGQREIIVVVVICLNQAQEETFTGSCFVGSRAAESAARATLDALNRRIHNLPIQAPRESETGK